MARTSADLRSKLATFAPRVEQLEERTLLSVSLSGTTLDIAGSNSADFVKVYVEDGNLAVKIVNSSGAQVHEIAPGTNIDRIQIRTFGGNDRVVVTPNVDEWLARSGNKAVTLDIDTGTGNDKIILGGRLDLDAIVDAGAGNDRVRTGSGDDVVEGGPGHDLIIGGAGNDELFGGAGRDKIRGGRGDDELHGNGGADFLWGQAGSDLLLGYLGNDRLFGAGGWDMLLGQQGRDLLNGGAGQDWTDASAGDHVRAAEREIELETVLTALLSDPITGAWGRADFSLEMAVEPGEFRLEAYLEIELYGPPNAVLPVYIGDQLVGMVTTDPEGYAWAEFYFELGVENEVHDDEPDDWDDSDDWDDEPENSLYASGTLSPAQLRFFQPGATLSVGGASGELFVSYFEYEEEW